MLRTFPAFHFPIHAYVLVLSLMPAVSAAEPAAPPIDGLPFEIVPFDTGAVVAGYPRVFFSAEEVERAKARVEADAGCKAVLDRLIVEADAQLDLELKPLDETWWQADKDKPWEETYPQVFQHTLREPAVYAAAANTLTTAWLLTGRAAYENKAEELLGHLASYQFVAEHYDVGMNYAVWVVQTLRAYDALLHEISTARRANIDAMFTRAARAVARNDIYWIRNNIGGGLNNHLAWHKMMLGLLGLFYDRPEMVRFCTNGPRGLVPLLEEGLLDDGLWIESSLVYHFTAIVPMAIFADCQRRRGESPSLFDLAAANGRTLKQPFDAMFKVLSPDGMVPPIGDAYGARAKLQDNPVYEYAWSAWGDPRHAWLLSRAKARPAQSLFSPPLPGETAAPAIRSELLPEHGYALLRSHTDGSYWDNPAARCAFFTYDRSGVHSNADKLGLMLFGQGRMLLSDVEGKATVPHAFSSRIQRELNRGGLSQNTVMIDGQNQRGVSRLLRLVEYRDLPDEKRVTAADEDGLLYEGVRQMRTICMTADYVLDVFQVNCGGRSRQIDWIAHIMDEQATAPREHNPALAGLQSFNLPGTGAWGWLRNARAGKWRGSPPLDWRAGNARLRLALLDPGDAQLILCDYPATDEPAGGAIPMLIIRRQGPSAVFAALWVAGDAPVEIELKSLASRGGFLVYEVRADGHTRRHLVPTLP